MGSEVVVVGSEVVVVGSEVVVLVPEVVVLVPEVVVVGSEVVVLVPGVDVVVSEGDAVVPGVVFVVPEVVVPEVVVPEVVVPEGGVASKSSDALIFISTVSVSENLANVAVPPAARASITTATVTATVRYTRRLRSVIVTTPLDICAEWWLNTLALGINCVLASCRL